jgi:hypothetical protein
MFDLRRFSQCFELMDTTRTGFVWRCLFKNVVTMMGYKLEECVLKDVYKELATPTLITKKIGIGIVNMYRQRTNSQVFFSNEEEQLGYVQQFLREDESLDRTVVIRNFYGTRNFPYKDYLVYVRIDVQDEPGRLYLHKSLDCECEGEQTKERIYSESFIDDPFV